VKAQEDDMLTIPVLMVIGALLALILMAILFPKFTRAMVLIVLFGPIVILTSLTVLGLR
jgi:positive regulator of sigma E activity